MKRFLCVVAIIALLPLSAYGWMMIGRGTVSGSAGECAGGSDGDLESTAFDSGTGMENGNVLLYSSFTAGSDNDGEVSYIHFYEDTVNTGAYIRAGVWDSAGNLLVSTAVIQGTNAADNLLHEALDDTLCIEDGTTYLVGVWFDNGDTWIGTGRTVYNASYDIYQVSMSTFGDFNTGDATVFMADRNICFSLNNSSDTF